MQLSSGALCAWPLSGVSAIRFSDVKPDWLVSLIHKNDEHLKSMERYRITDARHRYAGGYRNGYNIPNPHSTCAYINLACASISSSESAFYRSPSVLVTIQNALQALLNMQHEDGTIDLVDTNFHSTPDTAFMVKRMVPSYKLLKQSNTPAMGEVLVLFERFLKQAGKALVSGGIHTPNHRWVLCAALTKLHECWPDAAYLARIEEWLGEKMDQDPDGQYTEKSTYGYSAVIDRVLITMAKGLNKPELFEVVRKNLYMMQYYIHPNGEVVTEASNRQDKGQIGTMENYYYACRYMALKEGNGIFSAMCRLIEKTSPNAAMDSLNYLLEDPTLWKALPPVKPLPDSYVRAFPYSGVVRMRRGNWDATILSNNPAWLTFHKGNAVLRAMRVACSFFGKGQFQSAAIEEKNGRWVLTQKLEGPYYQPYPKDQIPGDGDWEKMPKANRRQSEVQQLESIVTISEHREGGIEVEIDMHGTDGVPVSLELVFRKGGTFKSVEASGQRVDAYLLKEQIGMYTVGEDSIRFGPGLAEHTWLTVRGGLPALDAPSVYLTGYTPFKQTIRVW